MKKVFIPSLKSFGILCLCLALAVFAAGCKGKQAEQPKPGSEQEIYTFDKLTPVLGKAQDAVSGLLDVTGDANELILSYRYYDEDLKNYDDDLVKDLAPKIEAMYKKFKGIDRVVFQVTTNNPLAPGEWKPYVNFTLNRAIVEKVSWSGVLTADFFQNIIELKRFD